MIVHLDTSALVDAFTGPRRGLDRLVTLIEAEHRLAISSIALYEWRRGPRSPAELQFQERLLPSDDVVPFGVAEALLAARLYATAARARGRAADLAVAACALAHGATLWTLNHRDFGDIPGLQLI